MKNSNQDSAVRNNANAAGTDVCQAMGGGDKGDISPRRLGFIAHAQVEFVRVLAKAIAVVLMKQAQPTPNAEASAAIRPKP